MIYRNAYVGNSSPGAKQKHMHNFLAKQMALENKKRNSLRHKHKNSLPYVCRLSVDLLSILSTLKIVYTSIKILFHVYVDFLSTFCRLCRLSLVDFSKHRKTIKTSHSTQSTFCRLSVDFVDFSCTQIFSCCAYFRSNNLSTLLSNPIFQFPMQFATPKIIYIYTYVHTIYTIYI